MSEKRPPKLSSEERQRRQFTDISADYLARLERSNLPIIGEAKHTAGWANPSSDPVADIKVAMKAMEAQFGGSPVTMNYSAMMAEPPIPLGQVATSVSTEEIQALNPEQLDYVMNTLVGPSLTATWDERSKTTTFTGAAKAVVQLRTMLDDYERMDITIKRRASRKIKRVHPGLKGSASPQTDTQDD